MNDTQIARLFAREQQLECELATVRARIRGARPEYAARHGLLAYPGIETMRKAVGA